MYSFRYGGKEGESRDLVMADDRVVVRTHGIPELADAVEAEDGRRLLDQLSPVAEFPEANVFVLQVQAPDDEQVERRDMVRRTLTQEPKIRFAGRVLQDPETGTPYVYTQNFFVKFHSGVRENQIQTMLDKHDLTIKEKLVYSENAYFVSAPEGSGAETVFRIADELLAEPEVELCHPELISPVAHRRVIANQWHLAPAAIRDIPIDAHANVEAAWSISRGAGITIAVIDDGVDVDHEEFRAAGKVVHPRDVTEQLDDARPKINYPPHAADNHGTACAGVACAAGDYQAAGVAPDAHLMPIRLRSGLGSQAEARAFVWAADHGADVISCSWGPPDGDWWNPQDARHFARFDLPDSTRLAMDYALTRGREGKGCVIVWAAGNGNESVDNDGYAAYDPIIAVAACNDRNTRSVYSDYGKAIWCCFPSNDFEWRPLHPAPQTPGIWTTDRSGYFGYNPGALEGRRAEGDDLGHYTNAFGGTSSSCPGVAGVAALMLAENPFLHHSEVKEILRYATEKIDEAGGSYDADGHSHFYGYGCVDAELAVQIVRALREQDVCLSEDEPEFDAITLAVAPTPEWTAAQVARRVADDVLGKTTWRLRPVPHMPNHFDAFYTGRAQVTQGKVWDWVYAVRGHRNVIHAEPSFIVSLPNVIDEPATSARRSAGVRQSHLPATNDDYAWSLTLVKAQEAWALDPPGDGKRRGEGIHIAHPDSGYRVHPELDADRVLAHLGKDFIDEDAPSPRDIFGTHGLATGSVIMSGDNPPQERPVVTGAAPQANLVPLRVTRPRAFIPAPVLSVMGMRFLRDAVTHAIETGCHIISMSLGGPFPNRVLEDAIRAAVENGLIVLAAAGNYWPGSVWPAAFPDVIAVAACNVQRRPWRFSTRGRQVNITAPGESVWKATLRADDEPDVVRSSGTSYAVAIVGGIAALWLAYHGRDNLVARYGKPGIAPVFKEILENHGADPSPDLPPHQFGAGIVNAVRVLEAPLPTSAPARGMRTLISAPSVFAADDKFEIIALLFEDASPGDVRNALLALLQISEEELAGKLAEIGDELAFRLMTDEDFYADFRDLLRQEEKTRHNRELLAPAIAVVARAASLEEPPASGRDEARRHLMSDISSTRMAQAMQSEAA